MPPIRTRNKKSRVTALPGLGFTPAIGLQVFEATAAAEQPASQSAGGAVTRLASGTGDACLVDEGMAMDAIGKPEGACEIAPTPDAVRKTFMPMNKGQKEVTFRDNQEWESSHRKWLGYETKRVVFGSSFILKEYVPSQNMSHN